MISARLLGLAVVTAGALAAVGACGSDGSSDNPDGSVLGDGGGDAYVPPTPSQYGLDTRAPNPTCLAPDRPPSTAQVKWVQIYNDAVLDQPMIIAQIPGDSTRWFAALRGDPDASGGDHSTVGGKIMSFPVATPAQVTQVGAVGPTDDLTSEGGLLGMAFHPNFAANGKLFVSYTANASDGNLHSYVGYLQSANKTGTDFGTTIHPVFDFQQSGAGNHKGGTLNFGKDGYLYMSFGDGGGGNDTYFNGQNPLTPYAKILRIDVDNPDTGKLYGIPADNPWKTNPPPGGGVPEMFAWGFRNPFRFSIDRESNELWVADVGQDAYEEIDAQIKSGGNYGWPCREGLHDSAVTDDTTDLGPMGQLHCPPGTVGTIDPVVEQPHATTSYRAIIGGYVYRGSQIPDFVGSYVYADDVGKNLATISLDPSTGAAVDSQLTDDEPAETWVSFAQDNDGELYLVSLFPGHIYKLTAADPPMASNFPTVLSKTGCFDPATMNPLPGLIPYGVNSPLWSDGATKQRWMALPDGGTITVDPTSGDWDFPIGTVLLKTFTVDNQRIETRMFTRHSDGDWAGYTYEWNDAGTDADYLPSSKTKMVGTQTWYYPSRSDCVNCHNAASGHSLGLELGQQNGDFVYPSTNRISNQLTTLDHLGMFGAPLGMTPDQIIAYPTPTGTTGSVEDRARSYLHANCSICHRPDGGGRSDMDLRFSNSFVDTKTCNVANEAGPVGDATKLLVPGQPTQSLISVRPHSPAANRMPPLASSVVDNSGIAVVDNWITSITACP